MTPDQALRIRRLRPGMADLANCDGVRCLVADARVVTSGAEIMVWDNTEQRMVGPLTVGEVLATRTVRHRSLPAWVSGSARDYVVVAVTG